MGLLPNPSRLFRRRAMYGGIVGESWFWGIIAVVLMRNSPLLRRKALYSGVFGDSLFWKGAAIYVFGTSTLGKIFGKHPEPLGRAKLGAGRFMVVRTVNPTSRRERRRLAKAGTPVPTIAERTSRAEAYLAKAAGDGS